MRSGVDVCVVSYKTPEYLEKFLESYKVFRNENQSLHLRVNDPSPEDLKVIANHSELIDNLITAENIGYARSVNGLSTLGDREVIAIFNADVAFTNEAVSRCAESLMAHDKWGVLGPRQVDSFNKITHGGIVGTPTHPRHRGWQQADKGQFNDVYEEAVTVSGSAYFIKRAIWEELSSCPMYLEACSNMQRIAEGAFLPTNHYFEETYCSYHARGHGYKVVYYGPESVIHEWHKSSPKGDKSTDGQMRNSKKLFRMACDLHGLERE